MKKVVLVAAVISIFGISEARPANGTGGIPAVLAKLEQISAQIDDNQKAIKTLQGDLAVLESNTVVCTLDRFINDECGDYNQPFDLSVTLCGNSAANAGAAADFQINNTNEFHIGVGFAEVLDVALVRNVEFPGVPGAALVNPGLVVYGVPFPNLQAGVDASAGIGVDGCIEIPVPIRDIPREQIIALMERWQAEGAALQQSMMSAYERLNLAPSRINAGLAGLQVVQSQTLSEAMDSHLNDPIEIFSRGTSHGNLIESLPIGQNMQRVLDQPELLMQALSQDMERPNLANAAATCQGFDSFDAPLLLRKPVINMCSPLADVPNFNQITDALNRIRDLPTATRVKDLICDNVTLSLLFTDCPGPL